MKRSYTINLYFQFFSHDKSPNVINLLRATGLFGNSDIARGFVKTLAHGSVAKKKFTSLDVLLARMAQSRFSQIEVTLDPATIKPSDIKGNVKSLNGVLTPSTTSALWLRTRDWRTHVTRTSENRWMTANNRERVMAHYGIRDEPSLFEMVMSLETSQSPSQILHRIPLLFAKKWPRAFEKLDVFGCVDVGGSDLFVMLGAGNVSLDGVRVMSNIEPPAYPVLGSRFDTLHPVMFGKRALCKGIARAVGRNARFIPARAGNAFGIVEIALETNIRTGMLRARRCLVEPKHNKAFTATRQVTFVNGRLGYVRRAWHANGTLVSEMPLRDGVIEGIAKQWNSRGDLLGSCEVINGNGIQRFWHENGKLELEIPVVGGQSTGRQRSYAEDGHLRGELYWIKDEMVSKRRYQQAGKRLSWLPRYND
jgi:hypothetical protein